MRWLITAVFIATAGLAWGRSGALDTVKGLGLQVLEGPVPVFHADSSREQADSLVALLGASVAFFEREVGLRESFSLAVLDQESWAELTSIPYGLPFVSGPPYLVCFPADINHELYKLIANGIAGAGFDQRYEMEEHELVNLFISLIGFHELGHVYARKLGLKHPNNWVFEFMATYFAYFYLDENFPRYGQLWEEVSAHMARRIKPAHRSLEAFEKLYVRVGVENYAWYQMAFLLRVAEVFRMKGGQFLRTLKDHEWQTESGDFYLGEMEQLMPGFREWAGRFRMGEISTVTH